MTDAAINPTVDKALVERTSYEREAIWLPNLAVQHWNAGQTVIEGKTFTDCVIEGPGLLAVLANTHFENCALGVTTDMRNLLYTPVGREKLSGVIGMANCRFLRCRFVQVAFTGSDELIEQLAGLPTVSQHKAGA